MVVSLPRDLVIPHPECVDPETGDRFDSMGAQPLNVAYGRGGLACVAATISALTGLPIQYAAASSFNGVIALTDAVGGVEVCVTEPMVDADSGVNLPAGRTTVAGQTALAFLRNRHGIGNGSDLSRIGGQQQYLSSLLRTIRSDSTLSDPAKLYALAQAAGHNIIPSTSLGSADTMVSLALTLKDVDLSSIVFVQYPVTAYVEDTNKVQPAFALAEELFTRILADEPVVLPDDSTASGTTLATPAPSSPENAGPAMTEAPSATAGPAAIQGLTGQRADQETCASAFSG
ncbi:LCP family protein [Herbiconiux sp.]|uniref:LCP family protein n=1 Tax=Herbiconiux sp. TaxID=1871186 RepID=UPI0025BB456F|nr:LCP family protein [Herbiconiux sp.]